MGLKFSKTILPDQLKSSEKIQLQLKLKFVYILQQDGNVSLESSFKSKLLNTEVLYTCECIMYLPNSFCKKNQIRCIQSQD